MSNILDANRIGNTCLTEQRVDERAGQTHFLDRGPDVFQCMRLFVFEWYVLSDHYRVHRQLPGFCIQVVFIGKIKYRIGSMSTCFYIYVCFCFSMT